MLCRLLLLALFLWLLLVAPACGSFFWLLGWPLGCRLWATPTQAGNAAVFCCPFLRLLGCRFARHLHSHVGMTVLLVPPRAPPVAPCRGLTYVPPGFFRSDLRNADTDMEALLSCKYHRVLHICLHHGSCRGLNYLLALRSWGWPGPQLRPTEQQQGFPDCLSYDGRLHFHVCRLRNLGVLSRHWRGCRHHTMSLCSVRLCLCPYVRTYMHTQTHAVACCSVSLCIC